MIDDLNIRRAYWDVHVNRAPREQHDMTDSIPYPFEGEEWRFYHKDVLEIGPGHGRQYERLRGAARSYSVCDISPVAMTESVFDSATAKYVMCDYRNDFGARFNVVHFWYVLHHIKTTEMDEFFAFVARHLRTGVIAMFNSPQSRNAEEWYNGDGMGTTWMDRAAVRKVYSLYLETVSVYQQDRLSSGELFVARKI